MKQVTQRLRDGRLEVLDVPLPALAAEGVLVDVRASVISAGTERSKVRAGRQSLLAKARSRPDQVRQVVEKAQRDGLTETIEAVRSRLDQPAPLGYSAAGVVRAVGSRVADLVPGDRVACGGASAAHAEVDHVPGNLCVPVPDGLTFEEAAFATVGSIALHGVRQADVRIGERVAVIGLGLIGQLTGQILRAGGCTVVGIDLSERLVEKAVALPAVDAGFTRGSLDGSELPPGARDCDAVVITAATSSSDPLALAPRLCRDRARVVVVGDVGMELSRAPYYDKELELRISRSYGPGRYDRVYEERGLDYPIGYVRWTERRNMAAFLELLARGKVKVAPLISERVAVDDAPAAYERLAGADESPLAVVLEYPPSEDGKREPRRTPARSAPRRPHAAGVIGAGSFAQRVLIPGLRDAGFSLDAVASASGLSAHAAAERFGFARTATADGVVSDPDLGLVAIATRHATHARLATAALRAGKAVYVEKPPALTEQELAELRRARDETGGLLAVGFNRRHAPLAEALREHVAAPGMPIELLYRVKAEHLPADHWLNDLEEGGGRLLGEGCHFVDFACWLVAATPGRVVASLRAAPGAHLAAAQAFTVALDFPDGSRATIVYGSRGARAVTKEYVEVHAGDRSAVLVDFRSLTRLGDGPARRERARSQDKGHRRQFAALRRWVDGVEEPARPDPLDSMAATLAALRSAETGGAVPVTT